MKEINEGKTIPVEPGNPYPRSLTSRGKWKIVGIGIIIFFLVYSLLWLIFFVAHNETKLGTMRTTPVAASTSGQQAIVRPFPDTDEGIHIFNDQLATWEMSEAQFQFATTHYAGTQKVFASDARRLRAHNSDFIILNYRLGLGLGYQGIGDNCQPNGTWVQVIEGEKWVREWPDNPPEEWFYQYNGQKVLFCEWGWYLMNPSNPAWRTYWTGEVLRQIQTNQADGIFVDGLFPPNQYGGDKFIPNLPAFDPEFENTWSKEIENFIQFGQSGALSDYHYIANVGYWLTGRDITDYSQTDGIFIEGFGRWENGDYFSDSEGDWQLQLDRVLGMVNLDKVVIVQQYVNEKNVDDRVFILGNYLLIKGSHTYLNMELSTTPEWFPEYEIPIGTPVGESLTSISSLWRSDWGVYARNFSHGLVLVNPSNATKEVELFQNYYLAIPFGGGLVPADGDISEWAIDYTQVSKVNLKAHQAAILLSTLPKK